MSKKMTTKEKVRYNEKFIELMETLSEIMMKQGEPFRARAYQKAQETIMNYPCDIVGVEQLKGQPGIGPTITEKLEEYVNTGTLKVIEREKNNPVNTLGDIYGVGPKKAKEMVDKGITSVAQLREKQDLHLNDVQRVGLKYYEDILQRIPRQEIDEYKTIFNESFSKVAGSNEDRFEIVGSYRRGALTSGDIDVIITSENSSVFKGFIDLLIKEKIIIEVLSRGSTKCLVICKLTPESVARRVDFLYTNQQEYPFSILYFTGSKIFNTVMRGKALEKGFTFNEHGMYSLVEKEGKKGNEKGPRVNNIFKDEKDIFDFLDLQYKRPEERIDGRAVKAKTESNVVPTNTSNQDNLTTEIVSTLEPEIQNITFLPESNSVLKILEKQLIPQEKNKKEKSKESKEKKPKEKTNKTKKKKLDLEWRIGGTWGLGRSRR
jgi:DNA polymerase beta